MSKNYATTTFATDALAEPERVSVALTDIAEGMREGCLRWRWAPGCR